MLDFGFSEILLTSAIALVVLGPERLPKVARQVGNWMGRARLMARQLSEQLEREVNAEELLRQQLDLKKHVDLQLDKPVSPPPETSSGRATATDEGLRRPHPTSAAAMHPTSAAAMHPTSAAAMHPTEASATQPEAPPAPPDPVESTQAP
jgi:sec-independent protein translocase protein TatB